MSKVLANDGTSCAQRDQFAYAGPEDEDVPTPAVVPEPPPPLIVASDEGDGGEDEAPARDSTGRFVGLTPPDGGPDDDDAGDA
jgi:hypothetical protein